jgi:Tfp pilus assembly protein PilF
MVAGRASVLLLSFPTMPPPRVRPAAVLAALAPLLLAQAPASLPPITRDLGAFGFPPTTGAAPGYIADRACALCHSDLAEPYAEKGMARAFQRPRPASDIEDFSAPPFVHAPSGQQLQMMRRDGRLVFRRWQTGVDGQPVNVFETEVDWILGSGDHARTYLYRTPGGELYQLPLAWYTQTGRWGMAPGFDRPDHEGVVRRVRRECVFCHTAYPDVPAGADAYGAPQVFPAELPEGIGCQRCHGPGAEHVGLALGGIGLRDEIRASIFNPGRLPAARRDEVCQTCHLQPSVALSGLRRFGRGDFSFRPGEPLADYLVQVDVEEEGKARSERFEINHHPYRLRQSKCFLESGGQLSCLTCHDPHRRVPEELKAARYRSACESCHGKEACTRPEHAAGSADPGDCAACHMPKRRTEDVVHVVMTDHRITRTPGGPALLAPRTENDPVLVDVRLLPGAPGGALGEVYRAAAVARTAGGAEALAYLEKKLSEARPAEIEPWLDLAQGQLRAVRPADAERTLTGVLERHPGHPQALEWLALALAGQGRLDEAIARLRQLLAAHPGRIEAEYNLGRLLAARGQNEEAAAHLEQALEARPNLAAGWHYLGEIRAAQGRPEDALACWRRALEVDPTSTKSYLSLGQTLLTRGERAEALRWLRHGAKAAARPEEVASALAAAEGGKR